MRKFLNAVVGLCLILGLTQCTDKETTPTPEGGGQQPPGLSDNVVEQEQLDQQSRDRQAQLEKQFSEHMKTLLTGAKDVRGENAPERIENPAAHVVMIAGVQCPVVRLYLPRILDIANEWKENNVQFYLVYGQLHEKEAEVLKVAKGEHELQDKELPFPVIFDTDQEITNALHASTLSQTFVLRKNYEIAYRGKFDNGFTQPDGMITQLIEPTRPYAKEAVDLTLKGFGANTPATISIGCAITRPREVNEAVGLTYNKDIAPIFRRTCEKCHSEGMIKEDIPFETYEDLEVFADTIAERVARRQMPPYNVDREIADRIGGYKTDKSLTDHEIQTIIAWVEAGYPEGSGSPPPSRLKKEGLWTLGKPDVVLTMDKPFKVKADGYINYQYYNAQEAVVDDELRPVKNDDGSIKTKQVTYKTDRDRWLLWAEVIPGAPTTVHHVVVTVKETKRGLYLIEPSTLVKGYEHDPLGSPFIKRLAGRFGASLHVGGSLHGLVRTYGVKGTKSMSYVAAYAPGEALIEWTNVDSTFVPAGSEIMIEMHYTPDGRERVDQTAIGLKFADEAAQNMMLSMALGRTVSVRMEANEKKLYTQDFIFRHKGKIMMFRPHAHLRGRDFIYEVQYPARYEDWNSVDVEDLKSMYSRFYTEEEIELVKHLSEPGISRREKNKRLFEAVDAGKVFEEPDSGQFFLPAHAILRVPHFDFFNQPYYSFKKPIVVPKGARVEVKSNFDNSASNPALNEEQYGKTAYYGIHTDQLMFFGYLNFVYLEGEYEGEPPNNWGWWIDFKEYDIDAANAEAEDNK